MESNTTETAKMKSKTVKWTAGNGAAIEIIVNGVNGTHSYVLKIDGQVTQVDTDMPYRINHPAAVGKFGPVGITQANWDAIKTAEAATKTAYVETEHDIELREYCESYDRVIESMNA